MALGMEYTERQHSKIVDDDNKKNVRALLCAKHPLRPRQQQLYTEETHQMLLLTELRLDQFAALAVVLFSSGFITLKNI